MSKPKLSEMLRRAYDSSADLLYVLTGPDDARSRALVKRAKLRMASDAKKRLAAAGMGADNNMEGVIRKDKDRSWEHDQMAQHGHAGNMMGDDEESPWDMEPMVSHMLERFGKDGFEEAMDCVRDGMRRGWDSSIEEEPMERQRMLEGAERAPRDKRDDRLARSTERSDSEQSEDENLRRNYISGKGRGGRFATDADIDAIHALLEARPAPAFGPPPRERSTGPNNLALDSAAQKAKFLKRLERLGA